jgi:DNA-directed RNA polymerase specialized sigma24 family protein
MFEFKLGANHEKGRKLEELYARYRKGDEYAITDAVRLLHSYVQDVAFSGYRSSGIPAEEFESYMIEAIYRAFENYEPQGANFVTFLCRYVNKAAIDVKTNRVAGGHATYASKVKVGTESVMSDANGEEDEVGNVDHLYAEEGVHRVGGKTFAYDAFDELIASDDVENEVVNKLTNGNAGVVIDYLRDNASTKEQRILDVVLDAFQHNASLNAAAKVLGVSYNTVTSNLSKLARYFNENRFGPASDYYRRSVRLKEGKKTNGTSVPMVEREQRSA